MKNISTYRTRRRRKRGFGASSYIMPFLILIAIGLIVVLAVVLFKTLFGAGNEASAYLHFVNGSARLKQWGSDSFVDLQADTQIKVGDQIITSQDARVIVEFIDGTIMRVAGDTDVEFSSIDENDAEINLVLSDGKLWFNKLYEDTGATQIEIEMKDSKVISNSGSIFSLEKEFDETVRVVNGNAVEVQIYDKERKKVIETEEVEVGQELVLTDDALQEYWAYASPEVIDSISEVYKRTAWYEWNADEDKSPTRFNKSDGMGGEFIAVDPEPVTDEEEEDENVEEESEEEDDENVDDENLDEEEDESDDSTEEESSSSVKTPTITTVSGVSSPNAEGVYVVRSGAGTLSGRVEGAAKVVVDGYTLTKFSPGDTTWKYLANPAYGLMKAGMNEYEVQAFDEEGNASSTLIVKVLYDPIVTETPTEDSSTDETADQSEPTEESTTSDTTADTTTDDSGSTFVQDNTEDTSTSDQTTDNTTDNNSSDSVEGSTSTNTGDTSVDTTDTTNTDTTVDNSAVPVTDTTDDSAGSSWINSQ